MRFYVDQTFPRDIDVQIKITDTCVRWTGQEIDDVDLIKYVGKQSFDFLAILGRQSSSRPEVKQATVDAGITLVLSNELNPQTAKAHLIAHLRAIEQKLSPGRILILYSSRVDELE